MVSRTLSCDVQFSINGAAYVQYGYGSHVELLGTKGVMHVGRSEGDFVRGTTVGQGTSCSFVGSWMTLFEDAYLAEDVTFAEAISSNTEPPVTSRDGMMAVWSIEAGTAPSGPAKLLRCEETCFL